MVHSAEKEKEKLTAKEKFSAIPKMEKSGKLLDTASVTTAKTTLGHRETLTARDAAYKVNLLMVISQHRSNTKELYRNTLPS